MEILEHEYFMGQRGSRTLFCIECISGRNVREYSMFQNEDEVMLLPGFHFTVTSVLDAGNDLCIINLKEIEAL